MKKGTSSSSKRRRVLPYIAAAAVLFFASGYITDRILTVTNYTCYTDKKGSGTLRIVNVSDLHNTLFGKEQSRLTEKVSELSPDIIVATGDIVNDITHYDNTLIFAEKASEIAPVYYASGNHERRASEKDYSEFLGRLSSHGVNVLNDSGAVVSVGGNTVNIIGIDDRSLKNGSYSKIVNELADDELYNIVLAHEPQYFETYRSLDAELFLSGHEHGGQIRLPFIGGLYAPGEGLFPKYSEGRFGSDGTELIVSRGLANMIWFCPRFFNLPEIVCIDIVFSE